jgi:molybdenum cofactor cytidylyltransferase
VPHKDGPICAVILAAGFSSRLGFDKLSIKIDKETVIRRAVRPFLIEPVAQIFVVAGNNDDALRQHLTDLTVTVVKNDHAELGMSSSVRAALPFIARFSGVIFHLGDKPFVRREVVSSLVAAFRDGRASIVATEHRGRRGHPVMLNVELFLEDMRGVAGDMGLREVIEKHSDDVICIEGGQECLCDIDTVGDMARLRKRGYLVEKG